MKIITTKLAGTSRAKWILLVALSSITVINYIDRQTVSILYPAMTKELHFPQQTYTALVTLFLIAYTAMYTVGGWLVDKIGAKMGLAIALVWWSAAMPLASMVNTAFWLEIYRVMLALGQPIVFSAGIKACAELFPPQQRALATGVFSAGSGIGALLATPILASITLHAGWRIAMAVPGLVGFLLVPVWIVSYNATPRQPSEMPSGNANSGGWADVLRKRSAWALILSRAVGDPLWYFCFFWIPIYLQQARHLDLKQIALFGWLPFLFADLGCVLGGSLSDALIRRGVEAKRSRLLVLISIACAAPLGALIGFTPSLWEAILLMGLLAFISQCWTTNVAALATDIFPPSSVGMVAGMLGTAGGLGAAVFFARRRIDFAIIWFHHSIRLRRIADADCGDPAVSASTIAKILFRIDGECCRQMNDEIRRKPQ